MNMPTPAIHNLAGRLIALEAAHGPAGAASRACDRLRLPLAKLAGAAGFRSLMARALALATAEVPWLAGVRVRADGALEGFDPAEGHHGEAGAAVLGHLLGLLVTFIGEPLTMRLIADAWPDAPAGGGQS